MLPDPLQLRPLPKSITPLDRSIRELRMIARFMTIDRDRGDALCELTLLTFLESDPPIEEDENYLPDFVRVMRKVYSAYLHPPVPADLSDPIVAHLANLSTERRAVAALHLGAGYSAEAIAEILDRRLCDVERVIAQLSIDLIVARSRPETTANTAEHTATPVRLA